MDQSTELEIAGTWTILKLGYRELCINRHDSFLYRPSARLTDLPSPTPPQFLILLTRFLDPN